MLLLSNARTITVDGITVFPDHADLNQFWYLPAPVSLSRRGADQSAQFTLILYKPAAVTAVARGGGFLMFETGLRVDKSTEQKILSRLSSISKKPRLTAVQFDEGKVQCIALNLQGGGGTGAGNAPEGSFNAVEKILGASVPSLHGDNSAAFSLQLSQEGATILREAFRKEGAPVGVLYNLKFTGIRPALEVKITADMKRVYDHFSASLSGQVYFVQLGIEAGIEKLKQSGALKVEVIHFTSDADRSEKERQAIQLFRDTLLKDFFTPTLTPGQLMGGGGGTAPGGGGTRQESLRRRRRHRARRRRHRAWRRRHRARRRRHRARRRRHRARRRRHRARRRRHCARRRRHCARRRRHRARRRRHCARRRRHRARRRRHRARRRRHCARRRRHRARRRRKWRGERRAHVGATPSPIGGEYPTAGCSCSRTRGRYAWRRRHCAWRRTAAAGRHSRRREALRPAEASHAPAEEALRPAGEALRPAGEALRPAGEALRPAGEALRPAGEALRPAGEALRPAEEALRLAGEAPRLAGEAPRPAGEALRPAGEALRPAGEAPRPAEEALPRPQPGGRRSPFPSS